MARHRTRSGARECKQMIVYGTVLVGSNILTVGILLLTLHVDKADCSQNNFQLNLLVQVHRVISSCVQTSCQSQLNSENIFVEDKFCSKSHN